MEAQFNPIQLRPTSLQIDLSALEKNFRAIAKHVSPAKVMPIVKSNAYGHGIIECSKHLERFGAAALGVALVEEGIQLRQAGIKIPILVLGGVLDEQIDLYLDSGLDLTASSVFKLQAIEQHAKVSKRRARVQLKLDTGLERIGVHYYNAQTLVDAVLSCKHCDIVGIFSHFATQDSEDPSYMKTQLARFLETVELFKKHGIHIPIRHIAGSGALMSFSESHLDLVRPGAALYGICPAPHLAGVIELHPVLSLRSKVVYFKVVKKGAGVSYGLTWHAPEDTRVVTIPVGYGDGYFRQFSNRGEVIIHGKRYPIVGRVGMDQLMVNIGPDGEAYNGDEVVLIGKQGQEEITVNQLAAMGDWDVREILVSLNLRIPRKYVSSRA